MNLYHGTSKKNANGILKVGFDKFCWFTTNRTRACYFGFKKNSKSNMCLSINIHQNTINSRYHVAGIYDNNEKQYASKDWLLDTTQKQNTDKSFIPSIENVPISEIKLAKTVWIKIMKKTTQTKGDSN